jgi:serine/threonine protein kinase
MFKIFYFHLEITEDGPAAESFIGTLAYMSPARINGLTEYSFEADMWSLGITMITVMTGRIPYPTANGSWQLMNAILKGPQPTITTADVSSEMHDFIHQCLNQPLRDKSCAQKLLDHAFLKSAKDRGILSVHEPAILAKRGKLMNFDLPTNPSMERIVEEAISWQLEQLKDQWLEDENTLWGVNNKGGCNPESLIEPKKGIFRRSISKFSASDVEWLALQMDAQNSVLEDK